MTETTFKEKLKEAIPEMPESFHEIIEDTMKAICNDAYKPNNQKHPPKSPSPDKG